ncbi:serpentine type 7TM GPCR chemoreceptor srh domain-containing protein [Ditylenchus destructor]|nr:serpentine type 7TM GPCR chemoreceptor srh domain-containing protein [Ditylenchus destructor]
MSTLSDGMSKADFSVTKSDVLGFQIQLHVSSVFDIFANLLAIWLITQKSPSSMINYKWFLLNIVISSMIFDFYVTTVMVPYPLFPVVGYCSTGLLRYFGIFWGVLVPILLLIEFLGICGVSIINAAICRLAATFDVQDLVTSKSSKAVMIIFQIFYATPTITLAGFVLRKIEEDQPILLEEVNKLNPSLDIQKHELCIFASVKETNLISVALATAIVQIIICAGAAITIILLSIVQLRKRKRFMSRKTLKLHYQLIFALTFQFMVPGLALLIPFSVVAVSVFTHLDFIRTYYVLQIGYQLATSHSLLNAGAMILCTSPYRRIVWHHIQNVLHYLFPKYMSRWVRKKQANVAPMSNISFNQIRSLAEIRFQRAENLAC